MVLDKRKTSSIQWFLISWSQKGQIIEGMDIVNNIRKLGSEYDETSTLAYITVENKIIWLDRSSRF